MKTHPEPTEPSYCNVRTWIVSLALCNIASWALGIIIFGLSLGTIKSPVFVNQVWTFLAPIYKVACADIACGVFLCVAGTFGCCALSYRQHLLSKIYSVILVLLFTFQLSIGIATLIISDEKTEFFRAVTILFCVDPVLVGENGSGGAGNGSVIDEGESFELTRLSSLVTSGPFDGLFAESDLPPMSYEECNYFADLSTPCGSLLICGAALYLYMLYCMQCLRDHDDRYGIDKVKMGKNSWRNGTLAFLTPNQQVPGVPQSQFFPSLAREEKTATVEVHA